MGGLSVLITPQCNLPDGVLNLVAINIHLGSEGILEGLYVLFEKSDANLFEMGMKGYRLVEAKFSWQEIADEMFRVYAWLNGREKCPSCVTMS